MGKPADNSHKNRAAVARQGHITWNRVNKDQAQGHLFI